MKKLTLFYEYLWVFIVGSLVGTIHETFLNFIKTGQIVVRSGLVHLPLIPVYGTGALVLYACCKGIKEPVKLFIVSALLGGMIEYIFSYLQELLFQTISWDYSNYPLNFNGRTSVFHMIFWGFMGMIYILTTRVVVQKVNLNISSSLLEKASILALILVLFDVTTSSIAAYRQRERVNGIPAHGPISRFFDKAYPDKRMDKVYSNKKVVTKEVITPTNNEIFEK